MLVHTFVLWLESLVALWLDPLRLRSVFVILISFLRKSFNFKNIEIVINKIFNLQLLFTLRQILQDKPKTNFTMNNMEGPPSGVGVQGYYPGNNNINSNNPMNYNDARPNNNININNQNPSSATVSANEPTFNDTLVVSDAMASNSRQLLYANIYNYLLENKYYDTARQFLRDTEVPITKSNDAAMNNYANRDDQEKDADNKDARQMLEKIPKDHLLRTKMVINSPDTFLLEWWQQFYLLNDFVEESSMETLREVESPHFEYVYPLLPNKSPVKSNNVPADKHGSVASSSEYPNNMNWSEQSANLSTPGPMGQFSAPPGSQQQPQQPPLQSQHSYMSQPSPQMGPQNPNLGGNLPPQQQQRQQMPSQGQPSPQIYAQQRQQIYANKQGQQLPQGMMNQGSPLVPNSNNNFMQDKQDGPTMAKQMRNTSSNAINMNMMDPMSMLSGLNANGSNINIQDPAMQQQYMTMLKSMMMKQQPYQVNGNNNKNTDKNGLAGEDIDSHVTGYPQNDNSNINNNEKDKQ
ncbi:hypothetical protein MOSE0_C05710 [Monosporozyma servazzii]